MQQGPQEMISDLIFAPLTSNVEWRQDGAGLSISTCGTLYNEYILGPAQLPESIVIQDDPERQVNIGDWAQKVNALAGDLFAQVHSQVLGPKAEAAARAKMHAAYDRPTPSTAPGANPWITSIDIKVAPRPTGDQPRDTLTDPIPHPLSYAVHLQLAAPGPKQRRLYWPSIGKFANVEEGQICIFHAVEQHSYTIVPLHDPSATAPQQFHITLIGTTPDIVANNGPVSLGLQDHIPHYLQPRQGAIALGSRENYSAYTERAMRQVSLDALEATGRRCGFDALECASGLRELDDTADIPSTHNITRKTMISDEQRRTRHACQAMPYPWKEPLFSHDGFLQYTQTDSEAKLAAHQERQDTLTEEPETIPLLLYTTTTEPSTYLSPRPPHTHITPGNNPATAQHSHSCEGSPSINCLNRRLQQLSLPTHNSPTHIQASNPTTRGKKRKVHQQDKGYKVPTINFSRAPQPRPKVAAPVPEAQALSSISAQPLQEKDMAAKDSDPVAIRDRVLDCIKQQCTVGVLKSYAERPTQEAGQVMRLGYVPKDTWTRTQLSVLGTPEDNGGGILNLIRQLNHLEEAGLTTDDQKAQINSLAINGCLELISKGGDGLLPPEAVTKLEAKLEQEWMKWEKIQDQRIEFIVTPDDLGMNVTDAKSNLTRVVLKANREEVVGRRLRDTSTHAAGTAAATRKKATIRQQVQWGMLAHHTIRQCTNRLVGQKGPHQRKQSEKSDYTDTIAFPQATGQQRILESRLNLFKHAIEAIKTASGSELDFEFFCMIPELVAALLQDLPRKQYPAEAQELLTETLASAELRELVTNIAEAAASFAKRIPLTLLQLQRSQQHPPTTPGHKRRRDGTIKEGHGPFAGHYPSKEEVVAMLSPSQEPNSTSRELARALLYNIVGALRYYYQQEDRATQKDNLWQPWHERSPLVQEFRRLSGVHPMPPDEDAVTRSIQSYVYWRCFACGTGSGTLLQALCDAPDAATAARLVDAHVQQSAEESPSQAPQAIVNPQLPGYSLTRAAILPAMDQAHAVCQQINAHLQEKAGEENGASFLDIYRIFANGLAFAQETPLAWVLSTDLVYDGIIGDSALRGQDILTYFQDEPTTFTRPFLGLQRILQIQQLLHQPTVYGPVLDRVCEALQQMLPRFPPEAVVGPCLLVDTLMTIASS